MVDAYAWIEYLDGTTRGVRVRDIVEDAHNTILTSLVTLAEVVSKFIREGRDPTIALKALEDNALLKPVDHQIARLTGQIHAEVKRKVRDFGLADAFVLATARSNSSRVLTGDPHFKSIPEATTI